MFRKLAQDAAQAGENIGKSISRFFEDTADRADESVATTMAAEDANVQAANAIRPKDPDLPAGSAPGAGPAEGSGAGQNSALARMLRGEEPPKYSITKSLLPKYKGEEIPGNSVWPGKAVRYSRSTDMTQPVAGVSNMILYTVQFTEKLDDDVAAGVARRAVENPDADLTTEDIHAGISAALASDEILTGSITDRHSEQEYRDFLARVLRKLDAMRPWPERPFQFVDPQSWGSLGSARLIARVKLCDLDVEPRLRTVFKPLGDREVITLRLRSGTQVALVAEWWPETHETALLLRDPHQTEADVLEEFCTATGITREEITATGGA